MTPVNGCFVNDELAISGRICLKLSVRGEQESKYDRYLAMRMWTSLGSVLQALARSRVDWMNDDYHCRQDNALHWNMWLLHSDAWS